MLRFVNNGFVKLKKAQVSDLLELFIVRPDVSDMTNGLVVAHVTNLTKL